MSQLNVRLARKRSQQLQKAKVQDTETSPEQVKEEGLRAWFGKSSGTTKSGRKVKGWVQVVVSMMVNLVLVNPVKRQLLNVSPHQREDP